MIRVQGSQQSIGGGRRQTERAGLSAIRTRTPPRPIPCSSSRWARQPGRRRGDWAPAAGRVNTGSEETALPTRRVVLSLGEAGLELLGAAFFEFRFRAKAPGDESLSGLAAARSLLPQATEADLVNKAEEALKEGRAAAQQGDHELAVERFSRVLEAAPRKYKLCQMALMARSESFKALGRREEQRLDSVQNWCWGRGLRWPGHYILAYILGRRAFVMEERPSNTGSQRSNKQSARSNAGTKQTQKRKGRGADRGTASAKQGGSSAQLSPEVPVVIALAAAYNYILLTYGLEY